MIQSINSDTWNCSSTRLRFSICNTCLKSEPLCDIGLNICAYERSCNCRRKNGRRLNARDLRSRSGRSVSCSRLRSSRRSLRRRVRALRASCLKSRTRAIRTHCGSVSKCRTASGPRGGSCSRTLCATSGASCSRSRTRPRASASRPTSHAAFSPLVASPSAQCSRTSSPASTTSRASISGTARARARRRARATRWVTGSRTATQRTTGCLKSAPSLYASSSSRAAIASSYKTSRPERTLFLLTPLWTLSMLSQAESTLVYERCFLHYSFVTSVNTVVRRSYAEYTLSNCSP